MQPTLTLLCFCLILSRLLPVPGGGRKENNLYDVLGVSHRSSQREIRAAYKRLAKEWHPDKNKSPEAPERIMEINKAYEVVTTARVACRSRDIYCSVQEGSESGKHLPCIYMCV